jgi:hypothetical protein
MKALRLIFGVIELRKTIGNFTASDEELKTFGNARASIGLSGEGANFNRVVDDVSWLP